MDSLALSVELLTAVRGGDLPALKKLLALHHPKLRARVVRKLSPDLRAKLSPEDILQEVYLEVAPRIGSFQHDGRRGAFYRWLCVILDHKIIDVCRAYRAGARDVAREAPQWPSDRASLDRLLGAVPLDSVTPSRVAARDEHIQLLLQAMTELPKDHQRVLQLRFLEDKSAGEAAATLGRTEPATHMLTRRALDRLAVELRRLGLKSFEV